MLQCWFWQLVLFYRRCSFGLMDFFLHFLPGYPRILHLFPTSLSNINFVNFFPAFKGLTFYLSILLQNSLHLFVVLASYMDFLPPPRCLARVICSGCGAQQQNRLRCHQHCWRLWHNFDNNNFHF